jgi:hypothetical protein
VGVTAAAPPAAEAVPGALLPVGVTAAALPAGEVVPAALPPEEAAELGGRRAAGVRYGSPEVELEHVPPAEAGRFASQAAAD